MDIRKGNLRTLWYEDTDGNIICSPYFEGEPTIPEKAVYQVSRFPTELTETCLEITEQEEVDNCDHLRKYIRETCGWIEGVKGRKCNKCGGTQIRMERQPWPEEWEGTGSREIYSATSSWSEDLVLAIANSGDYSLSASIIIAATSCERCMNVLAHKYGLDWGYEEGSEDWKKTNTSCQFCEGTIVGSQKEKLTGGYTWT